MSLIVARVVGQNIFIVGDTALTYLHKAGANPLLEGCLKQYRVSDQLAIAFAGDALVFEGVCKKLLACHDAAGVVEVAIRDIPKESDLDLLICENGQENITFFKRGVVTVAPSGFIGDSVAYDRFQAAFHDGDPHSLSAPANQGRFLRLPEPIDPGDTYVRLYNAMKVVIDDSKIPSVGGAIIPLCTDKGKFCFINHAETSLFLPSEIPDTWQRLHFGTAPMGGYSFDFGDDVPRGGSGDEVGFHLLQAGFGVIFPANSNGFRRAEWIEAATPPLWELNTTKRLGKGLGVCAAEGFEAR